MTKAVIFVVVSDKVPVEVTIRFVTDLNPSDYDDGSTVKDMINVEMENLTGGGISIDEYIELGNGFEIVMVPSKSKVHRKVEF